MRESNASLEVHLAILSHILVEIWETPLFEIQNITLSKRVEKSFPLSQSYHDFYKEGGTIISIAIRLKVRMIFTKRVEK